MANKKHTQIISIAIELQSMGLIKHVREWESGAVLCERVVGWDSIARMGSTLGGGQWNAYPHGVYQNLRGSGGWLHTESSVENIASAMAICKSVTGQTPSHSVGSSARNMLLWAAAKQPLQDDARTIMRGAEYGYHDCQSGTYEDCELLDMQSCYAVLLERLPSLRFSLSSTGRVLTQPMTRDELSRRRAVMDAVAQHKVLRNALWGTCLGCVSPGTYYTAGEVRTRAAFGGPFQIAALLVARMAWELTLSASYECNAVYSQTDGIICKSGQTPLSWKRHAMPYRVKARGDADIRNQHVYKIGGQRTHWYRQQDKFYHDTPRPPIPDRFYCNQFL